MREELPSGPYNRKRIYYTLTNKGRTELAEFLEYFEDIARKFGYTQPELD